ncbi:hypothetical protein ACVW0B_002389 [Thermostichus sp. MS-CIW-23]
MRLQPGFGLILQPNPQKLKRINLFNQMYEVAEFLAWTQRKLCQKLGKTSEDLTIDT